MVEGFLKFGVGMLALDGDAEQARKAGKEIGIRKIELAGVSGYRLPERRTADGLRRLVRSGR